MKEIKMQNKPEVQLTLEQIEMVIKEYIDRSIVEAVDKTSTTITFGLKDIAEDNGISPYRPVYKLNSAKVKLNFSSIKG